MARRVIDERPVGILYGRRDRPIALRVLGDARGLGVAAVLIPQGSPDVRPEWSHLRGLVVVNGPSVNWSEHELEAMHALRDNGTPVVLARLSSRRVPRELAGLSTIGLWERNYKVNPSTGAPGHKHLGDMFGDGRPPEGEQRRGYVFVSYASGDADFVAEAVVPALAEQGFGLFDYRGTEELNEAELAAELGRWVHECAVLLVVASKRWPKSENTIAELRHAQTLNRPVVILRRRSWPTWPESEPPPKPATVLFANPERDGPKLGRAIRRAIQSL